MRYLKNWCWIYYCSIQKNKAISLFLYTIEWVKRIIIYHFDILSRSTLETDFVFARTHQAAGAFQSEFGEQNLVLP